MMDDKKISERRKDERYTAIEGTYASISPHSNKLGQITDISKGGLCFEYIDTNHGHQGSRTQMKESLFLSSMDSYVGNLPFRIVSEYEVDNTQTFSSIKLRKSHVQFIDLNFKQLADLDHYLRNNVSGRVKKLPLSTIKSHGKNKEINESSVQKFYTS